MNLLHRIDRALARVEGWLVVAFLGLMVTFTFLQVFLRAVYTHSHLQWANTAAGSLAWSGPLSRLLVLWLTFLGASLITGDNRHIRIDLMADILPSRLQPLREIILSAACVLISAIMFRASLGYLRMEMTFGGPPLMGLPAWTGQVILPAGFLFILFRFFLRGLDQGLRILRGHGA